MFTDLRFTAMRTQTGVGKHIVQMVRGLASDATNSVDVLGTQDQIRGESVAEDNALGGLPATVIPMRWKAAEAVWTAFGRPYADRWLAGADWVYCPKNDFIPVRGTRVAVTIHGAAELDPLMPSPRTFYGRINRIRRKVAYRRMVKQSAAVLTVSEFLKCQIVNWFQADPDKVHVVGNGVEDTYFETAKERVTLSRKSSNRPFVLCIGGLNFLDGGDRIVAVAEQMGQHLPGVDLLLAGVQHERDLLKSAGSVSNLQLLGYVDAPRLASYLRDALVFFYPTRYETFGIAAAEAMAAGVPVVTSRCTAVPEIVGSAGIYVNVNDPAEVLQAIARLMRDKGLQQAFSEAGQRRAANYRWQSCVSRLKSVLERKFEL